MKLKKLLAMTLSATMIFSSAVAFAEVKVEENEDYGYVMTLAPTEEEIGLRRPTVTITANKLTDQSAVKSLSSSSWSNNHSVDNYDIYQLDFTASNLGKLFNGVDPDEELASAGIGLFKVVLTTTAFSENGVKKSLISGGNLTANQNAGDYTIQWATSDTENPYPKYDEETSSYMENGTLTMSSVVALAKDTYLAINDISAQIAYTVNMENIEATLGSVQSSLTIGTAPVTPDPEPEAKLAISAKKETAVGTPTMDGHVWSVKLTKGSADITELNAVFTADGYEPAERTIKSGLDTLNKLTPDGEGFLNFYIGLKTSKPEVGASFTVKNGVDTDATWPAAN